MNGKHITGATIVVAAAVGTFLVRPLSAGDRGAHGMTHDGTMSPEAAETVRHPAVKPGVTSAVHADTKAAPESLRLIAKSIDLAIRDLEAGKTSSALAELKRAKDLVARLQTQASATSRPADRVSGPAPAGKAGFINTKCPIMGGSINPAKVPERLIREYKGRKVAFCCGGCPSKWDKLSDAEKDARLGNGS